MHITKNKAALLFLILGTFFLTNTILAEFIGIKIFSLEGTLGLQPFNWKLFGQEGSLDLTAGVIWWPVVFIMTDIINEYYGRKGVQLLSFLTAGLIIYSFVMVFAAIHVTPADWWVSSYKEQGVNDAQIAFSTIFGQGQWIIFGSIIAFIIGQVLDAFVFQKVRKITGEKHVWFRANVSTFISQFIDSFVVLYIAFVLGPPKWSIALFLAVGTVNYCYKISVAVLLTPLIYLSRGLIDHFLGTELSAQLKAEAVGE